MSNHPPFSFVRTPLELKFRQVHLESRTWLAPNYLRVRLRGDELTGFSSPGCDDHIRVFFPDTSPHSVEQLRAAPSREYTPLAWGDNWLDLEFVVHGDSGIAGSWAATAEPGARIGVGGPRGSMVMQGSPNAWFLAGDETAIPAIRRFCQQMPTGTAGRVILEAKAPGHEIDIDAPAGVVREYVYRQNGAQSQALAARLAEFTAEHRPTPGVFGFIAAEQSIVKAGRALLIDRWQLAPESIIVKGYWKAGTAEYHAPH